MGRLVSVIASTHNPRICWNKDQGDPDDLKELYDSFQQLHDALAGAKPDALIVVANDHLDNFFFDNLPAFSVVTAASAEGPFWYEDEIMKLPKYRATIQTDLAQTVLRTGVERGLYFGQAAECRLDHAFTLPLSFIRPEQDIPIVPIFTNVFGYPIPTGRQWYDLGKFLLEVVAARPAHERIAIVTSFNMTVEVGGPKMGNFNREFSGMLLELMKSADVETMLNTLTIQRLVAEGNSTPEFFNYFAALGAIGARKPDFIKHKPVRGVGTCPLALWEVA